MRINLDGALNNFKHGANGRQMYWLLEQLTTNLKELKQRNSLDALEEFFDVFVFSEDREGRYE
jgi:hypothetical protein